MRRFLVVLAVLSVVVSAPLAYAACTSQMVTYQGRSVWCTTCCVGTSCWTNCY